MNKLFAALFAALVIPANALASLDIPPVLAAATASAVSTPTAQPSLTVVGQKALLGFTVVPTQAGYAMVWDATSAPADGVVAPGGCFPVSPPVSGGPNPFVSMANTPSGVQTVNGITVAFSTTGCFVKTAAPAFISISFQ